MESVPTGTTFFQSVAHVLAEAVEEDLERRGMFLMRNDEEGHEPTRYVDRHVPTPHALHQVTILDRWPDQAESFRADEFLSRFMRRWVDMLTIKLARPGALTTYKLRLPRGPEAAVWGIADNLVLRSILDYSMFDDMKLIRVDCLAKWDELPQNPSAAGNSR